MFSAHLQRELEPGIVLPQHEGYYQQFLSEIGEKLNIFEIIKAEELNSSEEIRANTRPETDIFDFARNKPEYKTLNFAQKEQVERAKSALTHLLTVDIESVWREHHQLAYQSLIKPLNSNRRHENWPGWNQESETKAVMLLHNSHGYLEWKVNFIRYLRYKAENAQFRKLQNFIDQYYHIDQLQPVEAGQLLGSTYLNELSKLGIPFLTTNSEQEIDPGKLDQLGLLPEDTIFVSPKFYLAMPDNPVVHKGSRSYVNLYQVIAIPRSQGNFEFFLLMDMCYAPLSLEELKAITQQFLPNQSLPDQITEQLILEATGIMPAEFLESAPVKLFLQLAHGLKRQMGGMALPFALNQSTQQQQLAAQKPNISQAAALFSQILLTEYALGQYFPKRQEYVSEILYRTFDVVLIAVLSNQQLTPEVCTKLLDEYRRNLVVKVEQIHRYEFAWDSYQMKWWSPRKRVDVHSDVREQNIYQQQQRAVAQRPELIALGNTFVMAMEPFIRGVTTGIPSCATCLLGAASKLGGLKPIPDMGGASAQLGAGGASGIGIANPWGIGGEGAYLNGQHRLPKFLSPARDFLGRSLHTTSDVMNEFSSSFNRINANDLGTFTLAPHVVQLTR